MSRFVLAAVMAILAAAAFAPAASAAKEWCTDDPPVTVWVNGMPVTVNVFISVPIEYVNLLHTARVSGTVRDDKIIVTVTGPNAPFKAFARIKRLGLAAGDLNKVYDPKETVVLTLNHVDPSQPGLAEVPALSSTATVNGRSVTVDIFFSTPEGQASAQHRPGLAPDLEVKDDKVIVTLVGPNVPFQAHAQIRLSESPILVPGTPYALALGLGAGDLDKTHEPGKLVRFTFNHVDDELED